MAEQKLTEEQQKEIAEIFLWRARFLFGRILKDLVEYSDMNRSKLGERAVEYDNILQERKLRYPGSLDGFPGRTGISRLINAKRPPAYGQVFVILRVLEHYFDEIGEDFNEELQNDLWHLALFGSPREVYDAYKKHEKLIDENSPEYIKALEAHKKKMGED